MDAGSHDASPSDAVDSSMDSGSDGSAAADGSAGDSGTQPTHYQMQMKAGCQLFGPVLADDGSWALARCGDQLGKLSTSDLHFDGHASSTGRLLQMAVLANDYVLYSEDYALNSLRLADGLSTSIPLGDVRQILALTSDKRHALIFNSEDAAGSQYVWVDVAGIDQPITILENRPASYNPGFEAFASDSSRVFMRRQDSGMDSVISIEVASGATTELGDVVLSTDAMKYAALDPATGVITVSSVNGAPSSTWQEPGYLPTRILTFTRDTSALIVDGPDDTRLVPVKGGKSVQLAKASVASTRNTEHIATGALFRWCDGSCPNGSVFGVVPLDGGPAQTRAFNVCFDSPKFSESGNQAVFSNQQGEVVVADARTATLTVVLKDLDVCQKISSLGISNDGRKVFACGSFGLRIADLQGTLLGSYPTAGAPVFSPNTTRFAVVVGNDLQIFELSSSQLLYYATLSPGHSLSWVDDDHFIYDDVNTVYLVRLQN